MIDSRSLNDLHPTVKRAADELIRRMAMLGYPVGIASTYRDFEKQNQLYAQGRTQPGQIVTNVKGGESIHNYRLAFDIFKNVKGHAYDDPKFFEKAGKIGRELGLEWGGSWSGFVDKPHFQWTGGLSLTQLKRGLMPPDTKLKWEIEKEMEEMQLKEEIERLRKENEKLSSEKREIAVEKERLEKELRSQEPTSVKILIDGEEREIRSAKIKDYNYPMMRPFAEALGYNVDYDEERKMPVINTK